MNIFFSKYQLPIHTLNIYFKDFNKKKKKANEKSFTLNCLSSVKN